MSFKVMTWAAGQKVGGPSAKLVLVMLADFAGDLGESHYSNARMAETCEISVDTLQRHLSSLEGMGLIARIASYRPDGSRSTNKTICLHSDAARAEAIRLGWKAGPETPEIEPPANCGPLPANYDAPAAPMRGPHRSSAGTPPQLCGGHKEPSYNHQESSPLPPKGAREGGEGLCDEVEPARAAVQPAGWERFHETWPWQDGTSESVDAARREFSKLSDAEKELCIKGAEAFQPRPGRVCAATFIKERHWSFGSRRSTAASGASSSGATSAKAFKRPDGTWWLSPETQQMQRWHDHERKAYGKARLGCTRPSEWPPGYVPPAHG